MALSDADEALIMICLEAALSPRQAEVMLLAGIDGLDEAAIAGRLSITVACVRTHRSNARKRIRREVERRAEWEQRQDDLREFVAHLRGEEAGVDNGSAGTLN